MSRRGSSKNTTADKDVIIHHDERLIDQIDGETPCGQGRNKAEENILMEKRPADKGRNIVCSSRDYQDIMRHSRASRQRGVPSE
eukprot:CAMPEP_0201741034 /NCGR_PEP_ID=MMETSP0593-20130828/46602_1 /ASSEMBLY_ACC=CAM_ASM_000672 /TAXON_ID=267983 /ORGANISM="Skeletonema japonicum, Strain CCMP2506" /LENGTH=83 /DNA_ID=CAMNT_0048235359 /DNA_START=1947 /DNA_END=2198 /DNA_ORIENTATION=+